MWIVDTRLPGLSEPISHCISRHRHAYHICCREAGRTQLKGYLAICEQRPLHPVRLWVSQTDDITHNQL